MEYVCNKSYNKKGMSLEYLQIKKGTKCPCINGVILYNNKPVCGIHSQDAYDYFSRNDDGKGLKRGQLVHAIVDSAKTKDDKYDEKWDKIWNDTSIQKYKRPEYDEYWIWNFDFYNAEIEDLVYIYNLIEEM